MKAGMYYSNRDVRLEELPKPVISDRDVLLKVKACGICGSDLMEWYRVKRAPLVLGHEVTGEIVQVGKDVSNLSEGDRVFAIHHVPCGTCSHCLRGSETACATFQAVNNFEPGGFSEFLRISGKSVDTGIMKLPPDVSYEEGTFIEPLGTVIRAQRSANIKPGESVLVIGAGLSGLLHIKIARALGAGRIMAADIHKSRLDAARRFGASFAAKSDKGLPQFIKEVNEGSLADKVILCTGATEGAALALNCVQPGGVILFFAVPKPGEAINVDFNPFWRNDITIKTSYGSAPIDHLQALNLLVMGRIEVRELVSHSFSLDKIQEAFSLAGEPDKCLKVLIKMD